MKLADVAAKQKKKFKVTTDSKHTMPVAPNLFNREFNVKEPDQVYVSDMTYIWTNEGWLYLAVIIDLFSRQVVGWSMNSRMSRDLIMNALLMAIWRRQPVPGLLFHSDRGSQYCSKDFQKMLTKHQMISSCQWSYENVPIMVMRKCTSLMCRRNSRPWNCGSHSKTELKRPLPAW